ncbi:MAG: hypothetical protein NVS9B10_15220 [Nevskia sp.]
MNTRLADRLAAALVALTSMVCVPGARADFIDLGTVPLPQLVGAQYTLIRQHLDTLHSPYASNLSLRGDGDTESTNTYGVYLGWEPLKHLQLYLDLELFQGAGISGTTGLGSLTNGDAIRAGSANLAKGPYIARKVLRYTLPLGSGTHPVARGKDSLAGEEADTRLEFRGGFVSVADDFDRNRYANDTRTQFQNWSLFNNTAWDFAADTRGYTGGGMLAYIATDWALRFGLYQVPKLANGQKLDSPLTRARGEYLELTLQPRPEGAVLRLLVYENVGNFGRYRAAINSAAAAGTTPDIVADDRRGRHKYGLALNGELPLADGGETGLFARLGWNDGRTESFAFTEVDRQLSFGAQVAGRHWGRGEDRLGLAYVIAGLSQDHRDYLAAGGQGFVVGDGRLAYGTERVLEAYYRFAPLRFLQISPDVQYIENPGYNRDRGPATVIGFRVHAEY